MDKRFLDKKIRKQVAKSKSKLMISPAVISSLNSLSQQLPTNKRRQLNLEKISKGNCCAVVTGQQIGLFCNPIFSIYKALSAVKTAATMEEETEIPHVPVFWLQTEDHDFEEVSAIYLSSKSGEIKTLQTQSSLPEKTSLVEHLVDEEIIRTIEVIKKDYEELEHTEAIISALKKSYQLGTPLYLAYAKFLDSLLHMHGLLFLNPRESPLYEQTNNIFLSSVNNFKEISALLKKREEELGSETQVSIREDSPLCFYHPNEHGERFRLIQKGNSWGLIGQNETSFSNEQINHSSALQFSCSALLRPLFQDSLLPTSVYIGGEAERKYMQQITVLYDFFEIDQPLIAPRASFAITQLKWSQWLAEINCSVEEFKNSNILKQKLLTALNPTEQQPKSLENELNAKIDKALIPLHEAIKATDSTLLGTLEKSRSKINYNMQLVFSKYTKALSSRDEVWNARIDKLKTALTPLGIPQERLISIIPLYAQHGDSIIEKIYDSIEPLTQSETKEIIL